MSVKRTIASSCGNFRFKRNPLCAALTAGVSALAIMPASFAQDTEVEQIIVTGIRRLCRALEQNRSAEQPIEVIQAKNTANCRPNLRGLETLRFRLPDRRFRHRVQIRATTPPRNQWSFYVDSGAGARHRFRRRSGITPSGSDQGPENHKAPSRTINLRTIAHSD